jgi:hypothetical protein
MHLALRWPLGFLTGAAWSLVNFLLILEIFKIILLRKEKSKLFVMLLLKFPVLYLGGFLLLIWRVFPVISLLSGAALVLLVTGVIRLCQKAS